ncbi:hypothetical protein [Ruminococcus sp.]|uniref:hypothetical protein n=1 Tax=Ruminococcus sp. TaxID=41978 RepID=UPI0025DE4ABB|nr:hypothetical protein [Ruminococcus sp.]
MNRNLKTVFAVATTISAIAAVNCSTVFNCSAEEASPNAYVYLRSVSEDVKYEGMDSSTNTVSAGAVTATVSKDGNYEVAIDLSKENSEMKIDEISILQLRVDAKSDEEAGANLKVDSLKIDGNDVALTGDQKCSKSEDGTSLYVDLCNVGDSDSKNLFNRKDYQNISTVTIDFTVTNWPSAEAETTEKATEPMEATEEKKSDEVLSVPKTGDTALILGIMTAVAAAVGVCVSKKRK